MMRALLRRLHPVAEQLGFYTSYQLQEAEYIGVSDASDSREQLRSRGYERVPRLLGIPLQATKTHPVSERDHDWALRKKDESDPQMQFHVHAWRIVFAGLTAQYGLGERELLLLIVAIVAVSAPESLDKLPVGPNKK